MKRLFKNASVATLLLAALAFSAGAFALKPGCDAPPCGGGGGNKPPTGESASNNLSYPVIWADGVLKPDFSVSTDPFVFVEIKKDELGYYTEVVTGTKVRCVGESDIVPPDKIPAGVLCDYGRLNEGLDEVTGLPVLTGEPRLWWLQQRQPYNAWQAFNVLVDTAVTGPVVVTGVDTGDLLESSITIKAKQIRTEFSLLKNASGDAVFGSYVLDPFNSVHTAGTFQALGMSGAVPGTDQSIAETQGTHFGPGPAAGELTGTQAMVDPTSVHVARNYFDPSLVTVLEADDPTPGIVPIEPPLGMHAYVYSACARLVIQKVVGTEEAIYWDSVAGSWMPRSLVNNPVVDLHAWDGSYSAEINAGGGLVYGYNWNTKNFAEGAGLYRMTFVLEGSAIHGGRCPINLNTMFDGTTRSINVGERHPAVLIPAGDAAFTHGEGGLVFVDVEIAVGGGGGRVK